MIQHSLLKFSASANVHTLDVLVAKSALSRMRGLLGRPRLSQGQGMLLRPCNLIHTVGMRYPIDVVFLRRDGLVLEVARELAPGRMRGRWGAHSVLELAGGEAARCAIVAGLTLPVGAL